MKSSLTELLREFEEQGISFSLEGDKIKLRGPKETLSQDLIERTREHKEALKLILKEEMAILLCLRCGKETLFIPTPETMDVFRRWECTECGWKLWRREDLKNGNPDVKER
jgi:DNA-directed RNA polymerase subunit RPC12/RpoP